MQIYKSSQDYTKKQGKHKVLFFHWHLLAHWHGWTIKRREELLNLEGQSSLWDALPIHTAVMMHLCLVSNIEEDLYRVMSTEESLKLEQTVKNGKRGISNCFFILVKNKLCVGLRILRGIKSWFWNEYGQCILH